MRKILKQNDAINFKDISHISISDDKNDDEECNIIDIDNNGSIVMRKLKKKNVLNIEQCLRNSFKKKESNHRKAISLLTPYMRMKEKNDMLKKIIDTKIERNNTINSTLFNNTRRFHKKDIDYKRNKFKNLFTISSYHTEHHHQKSNVVMPTISNYHHIERSSQEKKKVPSSSTKGKEVRNRVLLNNVLNRVVTIRNISSL